MTLESTPQADAPQPAEAPAVPAIPASIEGATPDEPLGEKGIAALKSEREARAAAEKKAAAAAARVKEFEDRDKSDAEKAAAALAQANAELEELRAAKLRSEVAAAKGVPADLLSGSTQEALEVSADALIAFRGEQPQPRMQIPNEGKTPTAPKVTSEPGVPRLAAAFDAAINAQ